MMFSPTYNYFPNQTYYPCYNMHPVQKHFPSRDTSRPVYLLEEKEIRPARRWLPADRGLSLVAPGAAVWSMGLIICCITAIAGNLWGSG